MIIPNEIIYPLVIAAVIALFGLINSYRKFVYASHALEQRIGDCERKLKDREAFILNAVDRIARLESKGK